MSEMRRMAKLLVASRSETFESRYPRAESERRVARALEGFKGGGMVYGLQWRDEGAMPVLEVRSDPSRGTRIFLHAASLFFAVLLAGSVWALVAPGDAGSRWWLVIVTIIAILAFPFVVVGYGSRREAEEATLRRRIRRAIVEEEEEPRP